MFKQIGEDIPIAEGKLSEISKPNITAVSTVVEDVAGISQPKKVKKRWGHELIFFNREYCCKQLTIHGGKQTSMHFHVYKHETLAVTSGTLVLRYKDKNGDEQAMRIPEGHAFVVPPGFMHQLSAELGTVVLIEASTYDQKEDSVRVHM
jgi:mannose-6-phosphate isomerase-like protein (cupin superfamily)